MSLSKPTNGVNTDYANRLGLAIDALNATGITFPFAVGSFAVAGLTRYLRHGDAETTEAEAYFVCPYAGYVNKVILQSGGTPGAGETYTLTMRKNAGDTSMTGAITNGLFAVTITTNAFAVAAGDYIAVKLVGSASAAASSFRGVVVVQPFA
ncbi:MAG: hypothetical protein IPM64_17445 [Phycisphaerales bacterium]|nr:hypothetical protein [Phycisphaerales bacterium]